MYIINNFGDSLVCILIIVGDSLVCILLINVGNSLVCILLTHMHKQCESMEWRKRWAGRPAVYQTFIFRAITLF